MRNRGTAAAFCKSLTLLTVFLSVCVCVCVCLCECVTTLPVLTYVNSGGRKRAGVRMTELLSYQPDNLLLGHALLRKWRL